MFAQCGPSSPGQCGDRDVVRGTAAVGVARSQDRGMAVCPANPSNYVPRASTRHSVRAVSVSSSFPAPDTDPNGSEQNLTYGQWAVVLTSLGK